MFEAIKNICYANAVLFIIVLVSVVIDFITGITKAIYMKNIQSEKLRKTIPKLIGYVAILLIGICLQLVFSNLAFIVKMLAVFIIIIEFISTLENIRHYVTIPKFLIKFLENQKDLIDNTEVNDNV